MINQVLKLAPKTRKAKSQMNPNFKTRENETTKRVSDAGFLIEISNVFQCKSNNVAGFLIAKAHGLLCKSNDFAGCLIAISHVFQCKSNDFAGFLIAKSIKISCFPI